MSVTAAANALTTVADVKYVWGKGQGDLAHDDRIQTLINLLSGRIEDWCGRKFKETAYDTPDFNAVYDGEELYGECWLYLRQFPVITFDSLTIDGVTIDASAYVVYKAEGKVFYQNGWGAGTGSLGAKQNVVAKYSAGFATVPGGLAMACVEWCIILLEGRMKDAKVKAEDMRLAMPDQIMMALQPYKRVDG